MLGDKHLLIDLQQGAWLEVIAEIFDILHSKQFAEQCEFVIEDDWDFVYDGISPEDDQLCVLLHSLAVNLAGSTMPPLCLAGLASDDEEVRQSTLAKQKEQ